MKRLLSILFASILFMGLPGAVAAQESDSGSKAAAGARFERGVELYGEGDYEAALVEFRRAYEISPGHEVLYNTALAQFQLGDYAGALKTLEKYLADGGDEIADDRRAKVQKELAKLRQRVGTLEVIVTEPGAEVSVDDVPRGKTPLDGPLLVSIGRRKVVVTKGTRRVDRLVDVGGGDALRVELQLPTTDPSPAPNPTGPAPQPQPLPEPTEPPDGGPDAVVVTLWSFTAALAVGAAITGPLALVASNDLDDLRNTLGTTQLEREEQQTQTQRLALATDVLIGAAAVMGTISLVVTLTGGDEAEGTEAARLRISPTGLGLSGSF